MRVLRTVIGGETVSRAGRGRTEAGLARRAGILRAVPRPPSARMDPSFFHRAPYFGENADFVAWGVSHVAVLVVSVLGYGGLVAWVRRQPEDVQQRVGTVVGAVPVVVWASFNLFRLAIGDWTKHVDIPLNLCPLVSFVLPLVLGPRRSTRVFEAVYFFALVGCMQALITPNLFEEAPHYMFWRYWLLHVSIIGAVAYALAVYRMRPTWAGLTRAYVALVAYVGVAKGLNTLLGTNYAFTQRKLDTASVLDALGPYPVYIFQALGVGLALFVLIYLPVTVGGHLARRRAAAG